MNSIKQMFENYCFIYYMVFYSYLLSRAGLSEHFGLLLVIGNFK